MLKVANPTNLGIRTSGLHSISSSPKYSVPSIYCNGSPLARRLTYCCSRLFSSLRPCLEATSAACSPSHLSSFCDEGKSRHTGSRDGNRGFRRLASRSKVGGMRGMRSRSPPQRGKVTQERWRVADQELRWSARRSHQLKAAVSRGSQREPKAQGRGNYSLVRNS